MAAVWRKPVQFTYSSFLWAAVVYVFSTFFVQAAHFLQDTDRISSTIPVVPIFIQAFPLLVYTNWIQWVLAGALPAELTQRGKSLSNWIFVIQASKLLTAMSLLAATFGFGVDHDEQSLSLPATALNLLIVLFQVLMILLLSVVRQWILALNQGRPFQQSQRFRFSLWCSFISSGLIFLATCVDVAYADQPVLIVTTPLFEVASSMFLAWITWKLVEGQMLKRAAVEVTLS